MPSPGYWLVRLSWVSPTLNAMLFWRHRWQHVKHKRTSRALAALVLFTAGRADGPRRVRFTRVSGRRLDEGDNLSGGFKALRDALAKLGVVAGGDSPASGNVWEYAQDLLPPDERPHTVVEVEDLC